MASHPFSPWHYLFVGFMFVIVVPFFIWHLGSNQNPGRQTFDSDASCIASNLLAEASAQAGACTVTPVPVVNKHVMTIYHPGEHSGPHQQYMITVGTPLVDRSTFQIVGANVLPDVTVGQPLYVMIFRRRIVMSLINGQAVESVDNPGNIASSTNFKKLMIAISVLVGVIVLGIAAKRFMSSQSDDIPMS